MIGQRLTWKLGGPGIGRGHDVERPHSDPGGPRLCHGGHTPLRVVRQRVVTYLNSSENMLIKYLLVQIHRETIKKDIWGENRKALLKFNANAIFNLRCLDIRILKILAGMDQVSNHSMNYLSSSHNLHSHVYSQLGFLKLKCLISAFHVT